MLDWPFNASYTLTVQGWGFWLGVVGIVVSVCGFAITIVQLVKTKAAATAVSDEINRIRFAVSKYDATLETSRAESSLDAARKFLKDGNWVQAGSALEEFSNSLHAIIELAVPELERHGEKIEIVMNHAAQLCVRLDRHGASGLPENERSKALAVLREHNRLATSLRIALQRSSIGD